MGDAGTPVVFAAGTSIVFGVTKPVLQDASISIPPHVATAPRKRISGGATYRNEHGLIIPTRPLVVVTMDINGADADGL